MSGILDPDILENARVELEKSYERLTPEDPTSAEVAEAIMTAFQRIEAGTYGSCALCFGEIDAERLRLFPYADKCVPCKALSEGNPAPKTFTDAPGVAVTADDMVELDCGHLAIVLDPKATSAFCPKCGRFEQIPTPAKQGDAVLASDVTAETPLSVPARKEGEGEAAVSPDPVDNKTSSGAGPGERTYADLAIPKLHGGANVLQSIPVDKIKPSPNNPREDVGDVSGLAKTIASLGRLINPITVTKNGDDGYHLTTGHRRLAAVKSLGWDVVSAHVVESSVSEQEIEEERLIENLQREDLSPLEEAKAYKRHVDKYGISQRELSERVGRSQAHVSKRIALLDLPKKAIDLVVSGGITLEESQAVHKLKPYPKRLNAALKSYRPDGHWGIEDIVDRELREQKRDEKKNASLKTLKDKGIKVVDSSITYQSRKSARLGKDYGNLDVDKRKHASESCHAAYLDYDFGIVTVCTDTSRHSKKGKSALKGKVVGSSTSRMSESPKQRAAKERKRGLQAAAKARVAYAEKIIDGRKRVGKDLVLELLVLPLVVGKSDVYQQELRVGADRICDRFGIDRGKLAPEEILGGLLEKSQATTADLALAVAIDNIEARLCPAFGDWDVDYRPYRPYFNWLEKHGYELSGAELERLAETKVAKSA